MVASQQPIVKLPSILYIVLALVVLIAVVVMIQVVYVRMKLSKYSNDDYYKQMLVKNEYQDTQSINACSNLGIYGMEIDATLTATLNSNAVKLSTQNTFALPSYHYTLPIGDKFASVEHTPTTYITIALIAGAAASRLTNDIAARKVDYVTWGQSLYRIAHFPDYSDKVPDAKKIPNRVYIALIPIPTLNELARHTNSAAQSTLTATSTNQPVITSFLSSSASAITQPLDLTKLPSLMQVVGYAV